MDRRKDVIDKLTSGLDDTVAFFESMTPDQLDREIYHEGAGWTARQVLAHLVTIERSMHWLFKNILSGGEGSPRDFDVDRFNQSQTAKLDGIPMGEMIERLREIRRGTVDLVASMTQEDLDREGYHVFHGHGRLERFIRWAYEHAAMHAADVQNILQKAE
ncbi:MAG: DinB family protein [Desulfobacteraceae bacterium]|jgi:hypothetical protein